MEEITMQPPKEEYPVIESDTFVDWDDGSVTEIKSLYVDEDTNVQLRVIDTHENTPIGEHTISLDDLYERMDFTPYEIIRSNNENL